MRTFYLGWELGEYLKIHAFPGFFVVTWHRIEFVARFFFIAALLPPFVMLSRVLRDRRVRFLVWLTTIAAAGVAGEVWCFPHYVAPLTTVAYALLLQCMRHLAVWRWRGRPVGAAMVRMVVVVCVLAVGVRAAGRALEVRPTSLEWWWQWSPSGNVARAKVMDDFKRAGGRHLVIVRFNPLHSVHEEWVQNEADIDAAQVVWAREMDDASNRELITYFSDRQVWLLEPTQNSFDLSPYPRH
jgi:hypothetical protein